MDSSLREYEVVVVGGGHAGCEAALAAARLGSETLLVTMGFPRVATMPCNPSVGGIAKSHLVFELDALGGEMARNADYTGIQFKTLNTRKGRAVQANRAQCDKQAYSRRMASVISGTPRLSVLDAEVTGVQVASGHVRGVILSDGTAVKASAVVLCPGTFLNGTLHIGSESWAGGRDGDPASLSLSDSLRSIGIRMGRLKTGTPPRIWRNSIHTERMVPQPGDEPPPLFSWAAREELRVFHVEQCRPLGGDPAMFHVEHCRPARTGTDTSTQSECPETSLGTRTTALGTDTRPWAIAHTQVPCHLTHTTGATADIVRANLSRSSLYGGFISGIGVRYCPSLEDKIVKFPDRDSHHVFVEPEGLTSDLAYPNGISNSLPRDVQLDICRSIPGMEDSRVARWAYAVEYDFADPTQLTHALECKTVEGLFLAGQLNGTTGYEEAAAQGLLAGINAHLSIGHHNTLLLNRIDGYIGVMIDDLVTKGVDEPYRMLTSRAEYRLSLRQGNARFRLRRAAEELGLADRAFLEQTARYEAAISAEIERLGTTRVGETTAEQMLRRPDLTYLDLPCADKALPPEVMEEVEVQVKYAGYIARERRAAEKSSSLEAVKIPSDMDYDSILQLKHEAREKLSRVRPATLGQASRIPGVNPADVFVLSIRLRSQPRKSSSVADT
jgi:tRNA uridine 5-carboxymethylaminomethyl modification enzyme